MLEITNFINYIRNNIFKVLLILGLYQIVEIFLGTINYPYIDDISRRVNGATNFGLHYARYLSEVGSWIVQGSRHLTDLGLTTYIMSGIILTLTSVLVTYLFSDGVRMTWTSAIASVFIGLNPWCLELLSFRFDSPYMVISIFLSILPFLWFRTNNFLFVFSSVICIFLMFNSYQGSSGIYMFLVVLFWLQLVLERVSIQKWFIFLLNSVFSFGIATIFYLFEMKFNPQLEERGDLTKLAELSDLPMTIWNNLITYFTVYREGLPSLWKYLLIIIIGIMVTKIVFQSNKLKLLNMVVVLVGLVISAILSLGIYIACVAPVADVRPRYAYGLAILLAFIMIILSQKLSKNFLSNLGRVAIVLLVYYSYTFSLGYISALDNQKTDFEAQSIVLASSLNHYVLKEGQKVYINHFFDDSTAFLNAKQNYNILAKLVPSNKSLYWPNLMWYNELTHSKIEFIQKDFTNLNVNELILLEKTSRFTIYSHGEDLFVIMK
ncbi:glucosyltransferase domain-containing protein [Streptococcus porci]|uniref:glucosyltransferase domain-containing protein n=1 Tax=Streptococcus porci TaxID=502567 RepID=UPI0003FFB7CB|nr:glucosyltransferase domain-containing protein [Streptococcus porci]